MLVRCLLTVGLAIVFVLTGCATDAPDVATSPTAEPSPTATATADAEPDEAALARIAKAAAATVDEGSARFTISVEAQETPQAFGAQGEEDFEEQRRRIVLEGPQGELEMLVDGSTVYFQLPATEDDTWIRVELDRLVGGDIGFGGPGGLPFQSPRDNLELLSETAVQATEAGEEDIGGDPTTRYDVVLDLAAVTERAEDATDTDSRGVLAQLGAQELDMTVWVDEEDRIRRIAYTLDLDQLAVEGQVATGEADVDPAGEVTVTVDYTDFGVPVDVELPDPGKVIDLDEEELRRTFSADEGS